MNIIFDLDGTLVDSANGVIDALKKSLDINQISPIINIGQKLIGPPLDVVLFNITGISDPKIIDKLKVTFLEIYDNTSVYETIAYGGITIMLENLKYQKHKLYIATNKRIKPTLRIIKNLSWESVFDGIYSLDSFNPPKEKKSQLLKEIIVTNHFDTEEVIYIGDKFDDQSAALENGIKFLAASWGYDEWKYEKKLVLQYPNEIYEYI